MSKGTPETTNTVDVPDAFKPYIFGNTGSTNEQGQTYWEGGTVGGGYYLAPGYYGEGSEIPTEGEEGYIGGILPKANEVFQGGGFAPNNQIGEGLQTGIDTANQGIADLQGLNAQTQQLYSQFANMDLVNDDVTQGLIDRSTRDLTKQLNEGIIPANEDSALSAGQFGSSRHGIADGVATSNAQSAIADTTASILGQARGQQLDAQNAAMQFSPQLAQQLGMPGQQSLGIGQLLQEFENASATSEADNLKGYTDLLAKLIPGSNTTSSTDDPNQSTRDAAGMAMAAYALYAMSDRRLKTDIEHTHTSNGIKFYRWTWNEIANRKGLIGKSTGVLAHEIKELLPNAVYEHEDYLRVDYRQVHQFIKDAEHA